MKVEMKLVFDPEKNDIDLTGPLNNKALCFAMLGLALEKVLKYEPSPIIAPFQPPL